MLTGGDADGAGGFFAQGAECRDLGLDLIEPRPHGASQPLAGFGGRHAARGAGQEPYAQPLLQRPHRVAERRLGNPELGRRPGEAFLARDGEECG